MKEIGDEHKNGGGERNISEWEAGERTKGMEQSMGEESGDKARHKAVHAGGRRAEGKRSDGVTQKATQSLRSGEAK